MSDKETNATKGDTTEQEAKAVKSPGASDRGIFRNNLVRTLVFLLIIALITWVCSETFTFADAERSYTVLDQFYDLEEDTVDCVYFGSSATQRGWNVPLAYHEEGVASYSLATASQPFMLTQYIMAEALKTQSPKLFIIELRGVAKGPDDLWDVAVRRVVDNMKMSVNKVKAIRDVTEYAEKGDNGVDLTGLSYYFPLLKYHSRWNPSKQPAYGGADYYLGYAIEPTVTFNVKKQKFIQYGENTHPLAEASQDELEKLLDYCDSIDSEVLFVISPYAASEKGMGKINTAKAIVEKRGYECLNCLPESVRKDIGLNDDTCYYNHEHLNMYGAELYTKYLSKYIKKNYGVKDRKDDGKHQAWEKEYKRLTDNITDGKYSESYQKMMDKVEKNQ